MTAKTISLRTTFLLTAAVLLGTASIAQTATQPATQPDPAIVRIAGGVAAGQLLSKTNPIYPQEAKDAHISGSVILHAIIAPDGTIQSLQLVSGPDLLAKSAWTAVKDWTYKPYLLNGKPTAVDTTITVNYTFGD